MSPGVIGANITYGENFPQEFRRGVHGNFHEVKEVYSAIPGIWLNGDLHTDEMSCVQVRAEDSIPGLVCRLHHALRQNYVCPAPLT